jgi:hypothetical protein
MKINSSSLTSDNNRKSGEEIINISEHDKIEKIKETKNNQKVKKKKLVFGELKDCFFKAINTNYII